MTKVSEIVLGMKLPTAKEAKMTADEISQAEKRRILRESRLATTYHSASQAFAEEDRGGRFAVLQKAQVTGSTPAVAYPKVPGGPWSEGPQGGDEPFIDGTGDGNRLGYRIDGRQEASKVASSGRLRR